MEQYQTIEQLAARVRELEEDDETYAKKDKANYELRQQLAASQAYAKQLLEAIEQYLAENEPSEFGCACDPSVGHLCGPCFAYKQQAVLREAISPHRYTSALDAYVSEKVKEAMK